jgi:hypothetical protein
MWADSVLFQSYETTRARVKGWKLKEWTRISWTLLKYSSTRQAKRVTRDPTESESDGARSRNESDWGRQDRIVSWGVLTNGKFSNRLSAAEPQHFAYSFSIVLTSRVSLRKALAGDCHLKLPSQVTGV